MNPNIIGFSGRLRSGKTELATICEKFGYERLYFAKPLKILVSKLINGTIDDVNLLKNGNEENNWKKIISQEDCEFISKETDIPFEKVTEILLNKEFNNTRDMLQIIGTDLIRSYNSDWHVDRIKSMMDKDKKYVIDDIRFTNEKKCIEDLGGIVWFVIRPKFDNISHHSSEETLKWQDFGTNLIINKYSLEYIKMIWENFLNCDYELSYQIRKKQLLLLFSNNDFCEKFIHNTEMFNALNFLLINNDIFTYSAQYKNNINITKVKPYQEKKLIVHWNDINIDSDIVSNALDIEDLKIYI